MLDGFDINAPCSGPPLPTKKDGEPWFIPDGCTEFFVGGEANGKIVIDGIMADCAETHKFGPIEYDIPHDRYVVQVVRVRNEL